MVSREKAEASKESPRTTRLRPILVVLLVPVLAVAGLWAWPRLSTLGERVHYAARAATFSDGLDKLQQTVIVPTLDSPMAEGRNVIWCSSFQLAWNEVRDRVVGAPLEVVGAEETAACLNAATQSVSDLDAKSVYAAGGRIRDGIVEKIQKDMPAKFPAHRPPDFGERPRPSEGILAYSFLAAHVPFKYPFRQIDEGLAFTDSQGVRTLVGGFGLWKAYLRAYQNVRAQVEVLYARRVEGDSEELAEYALDLCRHSTPYQVVVARVQLRGSLAETLEHLHAQMASFEKPPYSEMDKRFGANDELRLPEMFWRIDHRFEGLIDRMVANSNPPMPIVEALQTIEFRLDRSGAMVESDSTLAVESSPRYFEFDGPFLIYMQKRDAEHPFFVMWVDNAELLVRK